ncbi:MAG: hypothetical protein CMJ84_18090 [Planctomycetes bacterium]|jgi:hypothetical protein|nr:hypothetical protein [Planctomycetota bacterium]MDP6410156.1 DUF255 domain-containing protein [Planctomycetota bacterium]
MDWFEWNDEAFALARERGCPVFLFVKASWCRWCRELEDRVLSDESVAALLAERYVSISVDKDRRPDVEARYTRGGWPTLAYLDDTGEVLAVDNFMETEELATRLELVATYFAESRDEIRERLEREREELDRLERPEAIRSSPAALGTRNASLSLDIVDDVARTVSGTADPIHGGWGSRHKFPHPEAIDFALVRWSQTGEQVMLDTVRRTLRRMQAGEIHDSVEGGFYRYATQPDWSVPHHEKMLDSNAQRAFAYLDATQALGEESFARTARGVLDWMTETLLDESNGAFRGSQDADAAYAHLDTLEARRAKGAPPCDQTIFANWNAQAVTTLLKAGVVLDDVRWTQHALDTIDFLLEHLFDERTGMYHYFDGAPHLPGMLSDQAYTLQALVAVTQYTGRNEYLSAAECLAKLAVEHLKSDSGAFYDTRHDPGARGGMRQRNRSILENAVMAEGLLRLSCLAHDPDYEDSAREALSAFVSDYRRYGHYVSGYARAVDLLFNEPVRVTIVGPREDPLTRALARAALRPYVASRVVQTIDPIEDAELGEKLGVARPLEGVRAFIQRGRESYAETSDPVRLPAVMTRTERGS